MTTTTFINTVRFLTAFVFLMININMTASYEYVNIINMFGSSRVFVNFLIFAKAFSSFKAFLPSAVLSMSLWLVVGYYVIDPRAGLYTYFLAYAHSPLRELALQCMNFSIETNWLLKFNRNHFTPLCLCTISHAMNTLTDS